MQSKDFKILFVDDEEPNLIAFKATFRRRFTVLTAHDGSEGLEILGENPDIRVVISDQKMDSESGVEFLCRMMLIYPNPIRIILTGFTDHKAMTDAINLAHVYRFITKPWNEIDLTKTIESAIELYNQRIDLDKKNSELKLAYEELSKFVYSASHDMRAPLVSILGLIDIAKKDPLYENDEQYMPLIKRSVLKLDTFVRNIVDFYQNKERKSDVELVDLDDIVDESLRSLSYYPNLDLVKIVRKISINTPFYSDKFRLQVIVNNLISNGIKYQRPNSNEMVLEIEASDVPEGVELRFTDNGTGIPDESVERLFDMFYRATAKNTGSGIGLYIVKEATHSLGGTVAVQSVLGQGSTFTVLLPNTQSKD